MSIVNAKNLIRETLVDFASVPKDRNIEKWEHRLSQAYNELTEKEESPWLSVNDELPAVDEEVIILDDTGEISFGHIVDKTVAKDCNGRNIPHVAFWMHYRASGKMIEFFG